MIALASDHVGIQLKETIIHYLEQKNMPYKDYGPYTTERVNYPEYAFKAAQAVAKGICEKGILICGSGVGISIAANKVKGIRCVVCSEPYSALLSRQHNDTNMLAMGARVVGEDLATMIVENWLQGQFEGGRHTLRIEQISRIEQTGSFDDKEDGQ